MDCPTSPDSSPAPAGPVISYKRSRFSTRLPIDRRYVASHFWLAEVEPGLWRVGFTRFATRMLGDLVEHGFEVIPHDPIRVGQTIGWVEGFKALTDLYSVAEGTFEGGNPDLERDTTLIDKDPYSRGWLYLVRGTPDPNSVDVHGYIRLLDATIDKMQGSGS
ncbi:MAG TPA: glycine cleavage system protein H [Tepidisphaeraceae bacterium]|nr:glycine cleavage system protein H [Tepidisphaeraceae bacterium]